MYKKRPRSKLFFTTTSFTPYPNSYTKFSMDGIQDRHEHTKNLSVAAPRNPSKGGWNSAIFIIGISKTILVSFFIINFKSIKIFFFNFLYLKKWILFSHDLEQVLLINSFMYYLCSCGSSREICFLWFVWKSHNVPHKWSPWVHSHRS